MNVTVVGMIVVVVVMIVVVAVMIVVVEVMIVVVVVVIVNAFTSQSYVLQPRSSSHAFVIRNRRFLHDRCHCVH